MVQLAIGGIEIRRLGFLGKNGIDLHFINRANKLGKKVIGLEKDHNDVFAGIDPELQDKMLRLSLRNADLLEPDSIERMMKIWKAGDTNGMAEISEKQLKKDPSLAPAEDRILYDRNQKMADTIESYLKGDGVYMVAVGSAHLVGVEILEKRGFKVKQVLVGDEI